LAADSKPLARTLANEMRAFTSALIDPDALALYRLIVAEGWRFPALAHAFEQSGMRVIRERIANLLEAGGVPAKSLRPVASEVVALALGDAYQRAVLGIAEEDDAEAFERQIKSAVTHALNRRT